MADSESQVTRLYVRWKDGSTAVIKATDVEESTHKLIAEEIYRQMGRRPIALLYSVR